MMCHFQSIGDVILSGAQIDLLSASDLLRAIFDSYQIKSDISYIERVLETLCINLIILNWVQINGTTIK